MRVRPCWLAMRGFLHVLQLRCEMFWNRAKKTKAPYEVQKAPAVFFRFEPKADITIHELIEKHKGAVVVDRANRYKKGQTWVKPAAAPAT